MNDKIKIETTLVSLILCFTVPIFLVKIYLLDDCTNTCWPKHPTEIMLFLVLFIKSMHNVFLIGKRRKLIRDWTKYNWENKESHPPAPDRYLIYRKKCDKMHFEQWNGSGWASSNNDCTHYCLPQKP